MNRNYYKHIPCGQTIPLNNPYAFSVSLPSIQDVIEYEEETSVSKELIKSAYPRIVFHPYIVQILNIARQSLYLDNSILFLLPNLASAKTVSKLSETEPVFHEFNNYIVVSFKFNDNENATSYYSFMKHCGYMIFDREAEDLLISLGGIAEPFREDINSENPLAVIKNVLKSGYGTEDIIISNCGMNAIYAGLEVVRNSEEALGKKLFILYGWAYSDTIQIIKKCTKEYVIIPDVENVEYLELFLKARGHDVACIYLETVSNPLIAIPDFPNVYRLSEQYGFKVLVDNTFATPWNVNINPYCDLIFESLTKYASGQGDLMSGAVIMPVNSRLYTSSMSMIKKLIIPPYIKTLQRLAFSITGYKERVLLVNINAKKFLENIRNNKKIKSIYSVLSDVNINNWNKIKISDDSFCGVISIIFSGNISDFYDNMNLPKGPSLGTVFPIIMPYTLLAHYSETKSDKGLQYLKEIGLSPDLLRFSIGVDDPQMLIDEINKVTSI